MPFDLTSPNFAAEEFWLSEKNALLLNPDLDSKWAHQMGALVEFAEKENEIKGHIWISTSGTSQGRGKLVGLKKSSFFISAESVCQHLQVCSKDRWCLALPTFHVGGLGVLARAQFSNTPYFVYSGRWSPIRFTEFLAETRATLTSLVPTQVHDLVALKVPAPAHLRAVVVGGAHLSASLYREARKRGWPLLPSYGMTETCSQIATSSLEDLLTDDKNCEEPPLPKLLGHVEVRTHKEAYGDVLEVRSGALLTCYANWDGNLFKVWDPKENGYFHTEDFVKLEANKKEEIRIRVEGRLSDYIKIKGEGVHLPSLNRVLRVIVQEVYREVFEKASKGKEQTAETLSSPLCVLRAKSDDRTGSCLELLYDQEGANLGPHFFEKVLARYNAQVLSHEKALQFHEAGPGEGPVFQKLSQV